MSKRVIKSGYSSKYAKDSDWIHELSTGCGYQYDPLPSDIYYNDILEECLRKEFDEKLQNAIKQLKPKEIYKQPSMYSKDFYQKVYMQGSTEESYSRTFHKMRAEHCNPPEWVGNGYMDNLEYCLRKEFDEKLHEETNALKQEVALLKKALVDALDALVQK